MTENPPAAVLTPRDTPRDVSVSTDDTTRARAGQDDTSQAGTVDVAKDQAAGVGKSAADAGQHVVGVAADQAKTVVAEASSQAKDLLGQARTQLSEQASAQQQRLAASLHELADELHSMTQHSEQPGVATELARQGASTSHDIAAWLQDREPGHLVQELQSFARRRPGTFLLVAAGAGLLAGRLTRGVKDSTGEGGGATNDGGDTSDAGDTASPTPGRSSLTDRGYVGAMAEPDSISLSAYPESQYPEPIGSGSNGGAGR